MLVNGSFWMQPCGCADLRVPSRSLSDANPRTLPKLVQRPKDIYHQRYDMWQLWKRHFKNVNGWLCTDSTG